MATTTEPEKKTQDDLTQRVAHVHKPPADDIDPTETREWIEALEYVLANDGPDRVKFLLQRLGEKAYLEGVRLPITARTPYINTIPAEQEPPYPGDRELERKLKNYIRWNAAAMVAGANKRLDGIGGHISTYASAATLYEVAQNHFFQGYEQGGGDQVYFQGHASPGMYARAYLEGRITDAQFYNFRRELGEGGGLSSYPHPWLMPEFWSYPTVSMGLGPIMSIYQARFNRYLEHRGIKDTSQSQVWAFLGDGECDEPETLGAIGLAARESLGNLIWVINCNLQRLDGPVRGNGKIIQELEGIFRGAGWNVIKVIWGDNVDPLLDKDEDGLLVRRMGEVVDGQYQKYVGSSGEYIRNDFFGKYPELLKMVEDLSDEQIRRLRRGGHDPIKVYAAYKAAVDFEVAPTVVLAKTIKGYGLGASGEGQMTAHNKKKMEQEDLLAFRDRCEVPLSDEDALKCKPYLPPKDSPEMKYLHERRKALGGYVPSRKAEVEPLPVPDRQIFKNFYKGTGEKQASTTMAFVQMMRTLMKDKQFGKHIVPIVPDESRTFGMEGLFAEFGIYSHQGQLYEPVDKKYASFYKEIQDGQILEEGITEAGSMSSLIAAGTAHVSHGVNMIPMFIYYSMFGFQRIGDLIWAAADMRCRGFLIGGTSGRTTLNGEGLQHEDGHSHLLASTVPNLEAYDPTYAYEIAVILRDGIKRMYHDQEDLLYYITVHNENYVMPQMPEGAEEGIVKGMYLLSQKDAGAKRAKVTLFGSGSILREVLRAQEILANDYQVSSDVWSVTSYKHLAREAQDCQRWNLLHPTEKPRKSYLEQALEEHPSAAYVSSSDNVRAVAQQVAPFIPNHFYVLGTDGFGRSESRENLRRFFEVDAEFVTLAALSELVHNGALDASVLPDALKKLGINPEQPNPVTV